MTPRHIFRLCQLPRTIPFVAFWTAVAVLFNRVYFGFAWPREALFVTAAVTLPLLLGATFTSCLHAALHRPFALLLPDAARQFRRAAVLGHLLLAAAVTLLGCLIVPDAPVLALFGLVLALLTLACADRRQRATRFGSLSGLAGPLLVGAAWLAFHLRFAPALLPALQAAPGWFLLGGLVVAATTLALGFSRAALRQRATTPYFAAIVTWAALDRNVMRRQLEEQMQFKGRHSRSFPRLGRAWSLRQVGPRLRDWLRVLDQQQATSPRRLLWIGFVVTVVALSSGIGIVSALAFHGPTPPGGVFLGTLANLTAPSAELSQLARSGLTFLAVAVYAPLFGFNFSRPRLPYPLGRTRLAEVVFVHLCRQLVGGLAVRLLAFWLCSLLGQAVTHHVNAAGGLPAVAASGLALLPFLPLSALASFNSGTAPSRGLPALGALFVYLGAAVFLPFARLDERGLILSPAGLLLVLLATTAGTVWLRRRLRRHYRSCDLTAEAAWSSPFGVATR